MRAVIYTRVSTQEQADEGYSLSAQTETLERFAQLRGYTIVGSYSDPGRSGRSAQRPDFQRMMNDGRARLFDVIIVHKLDRFSRNLTDVVTCLADLEKSGVGLVSATEAFDYTTPSGRLMLTMLAGLAEWYVSNLSTEVKKGKKERARQGGWNGTLSYGYTTPRKLEQNLSELGERFKAGQLDQNDYSAQAEAIEATLEKYEHVHPTGAIPDPNTMNGIILAFSAYSTGRYSDRDIANMLNESGFRISSHGRENNLFGKETVSDILRNPFYTGMTSYAGGVSGSTARRKVASYIPGRHEPIISKSLFDKVQEVRAERTKRIAPRSGTFVKYFYPLTGMLTCLECGTSFGGWKNAKKRMYRHKPHDQACVGQPVTASADRIEQRITQFLKGLKLPEDWRQRILTQLGEMDSNTQDRIDELAKLESRLKRLAITFSYGDISQGEYEVERNTIKQRIATLEALQSAGKMQDYEQYAKIIKNISTLWEKASGEDRQILARHLFKKIYIADGAIKAVEPTTILWVLLTKGILLREGKEFSPHWDTSIIPPNTPHEVVSTLAS